ncbi:hypothetical protein ACQR1I_36235 [Bradyrhizobium sp. HKCCYLS2038]|uniref:hypothetical protein n=1 Tax=Bradyrhizobium sp. HKCCYLS2038 TaxID=3420764 RepID=UPI003EB8523A
MIAAFLAFFQALPSLVHGFEAFTKAHYDAKVKIVAARIGGDTETAKQIVSGLVSEGQTRVEWLRTVSQSKFLMWMVGLWSAPWIVYEWKVVLWDNILCKALFGVYGFTPEIKGLVAAWAGLILGGIFGTGGVMAAAGLFDKWRRA